MAQQTAFTDLEIRILKKETAGYPVEMTLNHEQQFERGYLTPRPKDESWQTILDPVVSGQELLDWFLTDGTLKENWGRVRARRPHRIRLRIDREAPELHSIPWELLQESQDGGLSLNLAQNAETPFSRYLAGTWYPGSPILKRPLKMLVAMANPANLASDYELAPIDIEEEWTLLQSVTAGAAIDCDLLPQSCTLSALEDKLKEGYHILHFIGHGRFSQKSDSAMLYLADDDNQVAQVKDVDFATMLASQLSRHDTQSEDKLRLVFLASCQTATRSVADAFRGFAPQLVAAGVPAVLAMQDLVSIDTARSFTQTFYQRLLAHGIVDLASNEARAKVQTKKQAGSAIPVLFMRLRSGQLLGTEGRIEGTKANDFWRPLLSNIQDQACIPFLGPRATARLLPDSETAAERLAKVYGYPLADNNNLARVAQFVALRGSNALRKDYISLMKRGLLDHLGIKATKAMRAKFRDKSLSEMIEVLDWKQRVLTLEENEIHHQLADLNLPLYLTTNFDNFMVEALRFKGREPVRAGLRWTQTEAGSPQYILKPSPTKENPVVFYLNGYDGDEAQEKHLVISEDDYLSHFVRLRRDWQTVLPMNVIDALTDQSFLFLGYSLGDWEFRLILQGLLHAVKYRSKFNVGVQLDVADNPNAEHVVEYFSKYLTYFNIEIYWGTTQQFVTELHARWQTYQTERDDTNTADDDFEDEEVDDDSPFL
ncbi:MAG: CHAT domain-containing protein [Chloroflexota bacterium]